MKRLTKDEFIKKAKEIHKGKYNYSKVDYVNNKTKVCIICPIHGEFWQTPHRHMEGDGCVKCSGLKKLTTDEFINESIKIHGNKYNYSNVKYINNRTKVCIICPIHGEFWQSPKAHLKGNNCPKCSHQSYKNTKEEFIKKAQKIHGDKYDYSKVEYVNNHTPICIICPEHGEFWQTPNAHLSGKNGCPICFESHLEKEVDLLLNNNNIAFEREKKFEWLFNKNEKKLKLDFYLPDLNIAIECQGLQHYILVPHMGGKKGLEKRKENDLIKREKCYEHNIPIIYYGKKEKIKNITHLLNELKKWEK